MRESAGKKIEDAAHALRCSAAKISRLENGKGVLRWRDVRDLITFYGSGERADLLGLVEAEADWFDGYDDVLRDEQFVKYLDLDTAGQFIHLEREATFIRTHETVLIPGLLQSEDYADAVCSLIFPDQTEEQRARFVEFRRARQRALFEQEKPPALSVLLDEGVICRRIGGVEVARRQLEALLTDLDGRLGAVDFRLVPLTASVRSMLAGPFTIMRLSDPTEQDVVHVEGLDDAHYFQDADTLRRYEALFAELEDAAMNRADSLARLSEEVQKLG